MPLHLTRIAFGATSFADLHQRLAGAGGEERRLRTRYLPKRHPELAGGSLFWIHQHALIGRTPLIGFERREDGHWDMRVEPRLIAVEPRARRAHQGWRYLADADAPPDLPQGADPAEALPAPLMRELARLGLV